MLVQGRTPEKEKESTTEDSYGIVYYNL